MLITVLIILFILIISFPVVKEKYQNIVLDTPNKDTKNPPIRTGGPFNICSPEKHRRVPKNGDAALKSLLIF